VQRILFDLWYLFRPPWDTRVSPPELTAFIRSHPPGSALDLGCGTGTNVITLARSGWRAKGVDFSAVAIRRARQRLAQAGITAQLLAADVLKPLPLHGSHDLALDIGCCHTLPDRDPYLRNLSRLLAVGGHWLMYCFLREPGADRAVGLTAADIDAFQSWGFRLLERQNGFDRHRPSAWLLFERVAAAQPHAFPHPHSG
jgi:SAM-dependent methyltransferase